jgi:hypothetical protein
MSEARPVQLLRASYVVTAALIFMPSFARADDKEAVWKLVSDPAEEQHIIGAARRSPVLIQNPCPAAKFEISRSYTAIQPIISGADDRIGNGTWQQGVNEQGCGVARQLNVLMIVDQGQVLVSPLLPGTTHADFRTQRQAIRSALDAIAAKPGASENNCNVSYVANTEFVGTDGAMAPGGRGPSWREIWTLAGCTQKALVPVHFVPEATGMIVTAGPKDAIKIEKLSPPGS